MSFDVAADAYDRFMGRYSRLLSPQLADLAGVHAGQRVLDVGCGPGALTAELVTRLGPVAVAAVDPSEPFVAAVRARYPEVDVRRASAERLPFPDGMFDAALAQLVVHFMADPVGGLTEMARVTRRDGVVAACVWDHGGGQGPLSLFWQAARELDPEVHDESQLAGVRAGHLATLFEAAGLSTVLSVGAEAGTSDSENNLAQAIRQGASQSFNQVGQQVVGRSLNVQPTITIRPGFPVRLLVTRDLILQPYRN